MYDKSTLPKIEIAGPAPKALIAVDIGNSSVKFGRFARGAEATNRVGGQCRLPEPTATFELSIAHATGGFDSARLAQWCEANVNSDTHWSIGSVHRGAGALLASTISGWARQLAVEWPIRALAYQDLPLSIRVDEPGKVGIDRLLATLAVNQVRAPRNAAIVIDLGTAITVDLVEADGAFAGGAILPGISMASRALSDQTDALPKVPLIATQAPPSPVGKSTTSAIEAGLFWGTVGALNQLIAKISENLSSPPDVFITGGAAPIVLDAISVKTRVRHVPHLVLSGVALLETPIDPAHKG